MYIGVMKLNLGRAVAGVAVLVITAGGAWGDWIKPYTSPQAQVDSIQRFLVIRDWRDSTFFGRTILPIGDVNGDNISDVIIGRRSFYVDWADDSAYIFLGGVNPSQVPVHSIGEFDEIPFVIKDINHDGFRDITTTPIPATELFISYGGPNMNNTPDVVFPGVWWSQQPYVTDLDGNGRQDLPLGRSVNGGYVDVYDVDVGSDTSPEYTIPDTTKSYGQNLAVCDFNDDSYPDLVVSGFLNIDTCFVKFYWGGPTFDTIPDFQIRRKSQGQFGKFLVPVGDFNADGADDIFIAGGGNERYGIFFGGTGRDDSLDIIMSRYFQSSAGLIPPTVVSARGDINDDGYPDITFSYNQGLSLNEIYVYLGGPDADSLVDVYIENYLHIPGPQDELGTVLSFVGDFNGDGIDDIAACSRTQTGCCWWAEVNFFAGWNNLATDVAPGDPILPGASSLSQNFPNPFNPSTTISFTLPRRGEATIVICNAIGQQVRTLFGQTLSAGEHVVNWDGRDANGKMVASGVYYYQLRTSSGAQAKKMILVK